jgi:uncharacterized damage-inducible protein DinB
MTPNELLAAGYRMGLRMLHGMCDDLTDAEFRHQPVPGANSAAWIVGHLAVVARRTADRLGATNLPVLTEEYVAQFSQTKKPAADQHALPGKEELLALLDVCGEKAMDAMRTLPSDALTQPSPNPSRFATNYGEAILFGSLHITMHCGQLSTIRRSLGKPPAL